MEEIKVPINLVGLDGGSILVSGARIDHVEKLGDGVSRVVLLAPEFLVKDDPILDDYLQKTTVEDLATVDGIDQAPPSE